MLPSVAIKLNVYHVCHSVG